MLLINVDGISGGTRRSNGKPEDTLLELEIGGEGGLLPVQASDASRVKFISPSVVRPSSGGVCGVTAGKFISPSKDDGIDKGLLVTGLDCMLTVFVAPLPFITDIPNGFPEMKPLGLVSSSKS